MPDDPPPPQSVAPEAMHCPLNIFHQGGGFIDHEGGRINWNAGFVSSDLGPGLNCMGETHAWVLVNKPVGMRVNIYFSQNSPW